MKRLLLLICLIGYCAGGCTFVACDRVFPKLTWYWSKDAVRCREER